MFRKPKQRMASMYYYMQTRVTTGEDGEPILQHGKPHFYGAGWAWGWKERTSDQVRMAIYNNKTMAETLGLYMGCQVNMVLGARCMSRHDWGGRGHSWASDAKIAAHAIKRVKKFKFAGLEGEWKLSICLFNYLMTGTRYVTRGQLADNRPTTSQTNSSSELYDETGVPSDPIDEPLYNFIEKRFRTQLEAYNISESTCPDLTEQSKVPSLDRLKVARLPVASGPMHNTTDDGCSICAEG